MDDNGGDDKGGGKGHNDKMASIDQFHFFSRHLFESLKAYCSIQTSSMPMTFLLGFYVSLIVKRWWDQYNLLPWPDSLAIYIVGLVQGHDERGRLMRRNIMRYVLLSYVITLRRVSFRYVNTIYFLK